MVEPIGGKSLSLGHCLKDSHSTRKLCVKLFMSKNKYLFFNSTYFIAVTTNKSILINTQIFNINLELVLVENMRHNSCHYYRMHASLENLNG